MQQAEVAELNRRAQHAEKESSAARAEAAAVRQAAAQQQAERAIAHYSQATRTAGLPFQDAQSAREYEPLPALGFARSVCQPFLAVTCVLLNGSTFVMQRDLRQHAPLLTEPLQCRQFKAIPFVACVLHSNAGLK